MLAYTARSLEANRSVKVLESRFESVRSKARLNLDIAGISRTKKREKRMIDVEKLRKLKGRRIYQFWLDEKTGDITDVTSRDDVIQVIRCKDCKYDHTCTHVMVRSSAGGGNIYCPVTYCSEGERRTDG